MLAIRYESCSLEGGKRDWAWRDWGRGIGHGGAGHGGAGHGRDWGRVDMGGSEEEGVDMGRLGIREWSVAGEEEELGRGCGHGSRSGMGGAWGRERWAWKAQGDSVEVEEV